MEIRTSILIRTVFYSSRGNMVRMESFKFWLCGSRQLTIYITLGTGVRSDYKNGNETLCRVIAKMWDGTWNMRRPLETVSVNTQFWRHNFGWTFSKCLNRMSYIQWAD